MSKRLQNLNELFFDLYKSGHLISSPPSQRNLMKFLCVLVLLVAVAVAQHFDPDEPEIARYQDDPYDCSLDLDPYSCYMRRFKSSQPHPVHHDGSHFRRFKSILSNPQPGQDICAGLSPAHCELLKEYLKQA